MLRPLRKASDLPTCLERLWPPMPSWAFIILLACSVFEGPGILGAWGGFGGLAWGLDAPGTKGLALGLSLDIWGLLWVGGWCSSPGRKLASWQRANWQMKTAP